MSRNRGSLSGSTGQRSGTLHSTTVVTHVGIYGWRKRCLYALVFTLLVTVIINIALTIWIIRVMDFSVHGMGKLRIVDNGLRLEGDAEFLKSLFARRILSTANSGLKIQSDKNITLFSQDKHHHVKNSITLGDGGTVLSGYLQTPLVRSHLRSDLSIESPAKGVQIAAAQRIRLTASHGYITAAARDRITLQSATDHIILDAKNITMKGIPFSETDSNAPTFPLVYQLCICGNNGKLFRSQSLGTCQASVEICS